jgi:8-oxo-dGTP pyrophosphatase MutT (NUDIX family)
MAMSDVKALPAASVLILRNDPLEVLMILRPAESTFVPDMWVFPGGALDPADGSPDDLDALKRAAVREVREETGIDLQGELVWTSRWITPAGMPKRFDTWFFLASVPRETPVVLQASEAVDYRWIAPADALRRKDLRMVFPTIKNLEAIQDFSSAEELLRSRLGAKIEAVQPVLVVDGDRKKIVLP